MANRWPNGSNIKVIRRSLDTRIVHRCKLGAGDCQLTTKQSFLEISSCQSSAIETTFQFGAKLTEQIITDVAMIVFTSFCLNDQCNRFGLKRWFIEHFKSYVTVFVSLKSVDKRTSYSIFSNMPFQVRVQPVNTWKFNLIADKFVVWSSCTHKMFGRLILELCGSWCFIEIGWKMNELFYF